MIRGVLEATVYADDLGAARRFYGGVLGLPEVAAQADRHVFFRAGNSVLLVFRAEATRQPPAPGALPVPPHGATGPGHVFLTVAEDALSELADRLAEAGVPVEADFRWPHGPRSIYVRDPAENSVEFASPRLWNLPE